MSFLEKIIDETRTRVERAKTLGYLPKLEKRARSLAAGRPSGQFHASLARPESVNIIAEIKRASPSKGAINANADVAKIARSYQDGNAAAISVLTEPDHFGGSIRDLTTAANSSRLPVLRKDFIIDPYQVVETAATGASAVLLIVAALSESQLIALTRYAAELGLDVLTEVHTETEMQRAINTGAKIIGVNNRDLTSLEVSLDVSRRLIARKPANVLMVSESGISTHDQIAELRDLGYDGFLIGESLMTRSDPTAALKELMGE